MRNLKRVLSLVLATVMLLGMMVMSTSAANVSDFSDADQIGNLEAASIVTGLGIFVGDTSGNFDPQRPVTRAEMATIICKILYGSNVNGDNFKGIGTFTDAKTYQGGWAEGYINMCQSQGIVNGYNATTFGASDTVTTWQAALMLQRALGWWAPAADEPINELSVTGKAANLGLYGDLTLSVNAPLTREDVAVLVFNALFAQRVHYDDVRGLYTKDNDRNVVVNNGTEDSSNTLAQNTFGLQVVDGVVLRNSAVDPDLAATESNGAMTTVRLDRSTVEHDFEYETGVDLIGHAVKVYYTVRNREEIVYAITDHAVVADVITYSNDYGTMNSAAVAAGFKSRSLGEDANKYYANYDLSAQVEHANGVSAHPGDYLVLISNSSNKQVDFAILLNQYLDVVSVSDDINGDPIYEIQEYGEDIYLADKFVDGQFAIVTPTDFNHQKSDTAEFAIVEAAEVVDSTITKITGRSVGTGSDYRMITAGGENYRQSPVEERDNRSALHNDERITAFQDIKELGEATLVLDTYGKLIALDKIVEQTIDYVYVSQFGYKYGEISSLKDKIVLTAEVWLPDGTSKIVTVNTDTNTGTTTAKYTSQSIIAALLDGGSVAIEKKYAYLNALTTDFDSGAGANNSGTYLGVYYMKPVPGTSTVSLKLPSELDDATYTNEAGNNASDLYYFNDQSTPDDSDDTGTAAKSVRIVTNHNTFLRGTNNVVKAGTSKPLYQNRNTMYYYVDGNYGTPGFTVNVSMGIANQETFTLEDNPATEKDATWLEEAWVRQPAGDNSKISVEAVVVHGRNVVEDQGIYYYNEGNYEISNSGDEKLLTVYAYDASGNEHSFTYTYNKEEDARNAANGGLLRDYADKLKNDGQGIPSGYYTFYTNGMAPVATVESLNNDTPAVMASDGVISGKEILGPGASATRGTAYVAHGTALASSVYRYEYNLYTDATDQGVIYTDARVIDLQGGKYNSVERLHNAMTARDENTDPAISNVVVSYSYNRANYECGVLYVISYTEAGVAPETPPTPPTEDKAETWVDLNTNKAQVKYYTTADTSGSTTDEKDNEAAEAILAKLKTMYASVNVALSGSNYVFTCKTASGIPYVYTYDITSDSGRYTDKAVIYTEDGETKAAAKAAGQEYTVWTARSNEFARYKAADAENWTYTIGNINATQGMEIETGFLKLDDVKVKGGASPVADPRTVLSNAIEVEESGVKVYYVKGSDTVSVEGSNMGTGLVSNSTTYKAYSITYANLGAHTSGNMLAIDLGYVEVTAPTGVAQGAAVEKVYATIAVSGGATYAAVGTDVQYTLTPGIDTQATEAMVITATLPEGYTTDDGKATVTVDVSKDATTAPAPVTFKIEAGNTNIGAVVVTVVKKT